MAIKFTSIVSRGEDKGEPMEAWKDKDGNYVLFDPSRRRGGSGHADDYTLVRTAQSAKRLIQERGYSMRMRVAGMRSGAASMIKADRIVVIDLTDTPNEQGMASQ